MKHFRDVHIWYGCKVKTYFYDVKLQRSKSNFLEYNPSTGVCMLQYWLRLRNSYYNDKLKRLQDYLKGEFSRLIESEKMPNTRVIIDLQKGWGGIHYLEYHFRLTNKPSAYICNEFERILKSIEDIY